MLENGTPTVIRNVGIAMFDGIERLDYEGPLGVLGWTNR